MNEILSAITTVGFPIVACIGLGWFCKYMIDQRQKNTDRMFEMFEKGNAENRMHTIKAVMYLLMK